MGFHAGTAIRQLDVFAKWLENIKDAPTKQRLVKRLRKVQLGALGDVKPVGDGVFEMREHFGSGWRMYFIERNQEIIVMLGGGVKSTQSADIRKAIKLATLLED